MPSDCLLNRKFVMMGNLRPARLTLPIALLRAREVVMDLFRPMLHAHGATEQQWRVLRVIREAGATDATALARNACILAPSLSRANPSAINLSTSGASASL